MDRRWTRILEGELVPGSESAARRRCLLVAGLIWALAPRVAATCPLDAPAAPRVLILALDGVPLRVIEVARQRGAFADWPAPVALVSTFPSMTNVAFTAMLDGLGAQPIAGYETRHYDAATNHLVGGSGPSYAWKQMFEVIGTTFGAKKALYTSPKRRARKVLSLTEEALLDRSEPALVLAHMAPTDMLTHMRGDESTLGVVMAVAEALERLIAEHRERHGRDLEIVLLSDHGNGAEKVAYTKGLRDALRAAGFKFTKQLGEPRHIVAPTYGAVNYGALYLDAARAAAAAEAAVQHDSVDLAAWVDASGRIAVLSRHGQATIAWRDVGSDRAYSYDIEFGDPLRLSKARARMEGLGAIDEGFGAQAQWLEASSDGEYPDALRRLVDALTDRYVENPATVILSLGPRYAWGQGSVRFGASLMGGRLEGTHGGLDRESSVGFLMATNRRLQPENVVSADRALAAWADLRGCLEPQGR